MKIYTTVSITVIISLANTVFGLVQFAIKELAASQSKVIPYVQVSKDAKTSPLASYSIIIVIESQPELTTSTTVTCCEMILEL